MAPFCLSEFRFLKERFRFSFALSFLVPLILIFEPLIFCDMLTSVPSPVTSEDVFRLAAELVPVDPILLQHVIRSRFCVSVKPKKIIIFPRYAER